MFNNLKKYLSIGAVAMTLLLPVSVRAATEAEIEQLEKQLIQKESQLLDPELKLDKLVVERAKLDGMGGWFQGSKKKEIDRQISETQTAIDRTYSEMKGLQQQVQDAVFAVAQTLEGKGQYLKAIEYYLKIERQDDRIKFRIGTCYKLAQDYSSAIQWFLKLTRTDQNLLEVVDCYKLAGGMKDSIYWLFQILEPIDLNSSELIALKLIEEYDYASKKVDFPNFEKRLSDVYLSKAVREYRSDFAAACRDYSKAISLISANSDPKSVSLGIVTRSQNELQTAIQMLEQQREAAERNYEDMLRNARRDLEETERRFRNAQYDAEQEYNRRLDYARRDLRGAQDELNRLVATPGTATGTIDAARQNVQYKDNQVRYVESHRYDIIEDYMRPYRREVDQARDKYDEIVRSRVQIIERYIAPYKAKVEQARASFDMIRSLHESTFGK